MTMSEHQVNSIHMWNLPGTKHYYATSKWKIIIWDPRGQITLGSCASSICNIIIRATKPVDQF